MNDDLSQREKRRLRRSRRALRAAREHMSDPRAKLPRLLAAYNELQAQGTRRWVLPEA